MAGLLKRDDILKVDDRAMELVQVPEWGGEVWVRGLNGAERDKFEASMVQTRGKSQTVNMANVRARLAAASMCDEGGVRLFTDADVDALGQKGAAALQRVFLVAQRLSGIGEEDVKELAEGLKNSPLGGLPSA